MDFRVETGPTACNDWEQECPTSGTPEFLDTWTCTGGCEGRYHKKCLEPFRGQCFDCSEVIQSRVGIIEATFLNKVCFFWSGS